LLAVLRLFISHFEFKWHFTFVGLGIFDFFDVVFLLVYLVAGPLGLQLDSWLIWFTNYGVARVL
jgi:hypothetical protein